MPSTAEVIKELAKSMFHCCHYLILEVGEKK